MSDAPKIVSLRGDPISQPGVSIPAVVSSLEELLEMARSGEIKGIAIAVLHADDATSMRRVGVQTRGCLEIMKHELCRCADA